MGQEASVPQNDTNEQHQHALEEQLAPPSIALPPGNSNKSSKQTTNRIGNLMRSFEHRDAARNTTSATTTTSTPSTSTYDPSSLQPNTSDEAFALQKMPDTTSTAAESSSSMMDRKSLLSGKARQSARGVISSMRNLSMGISQHHRKQQQQKTEQVQDWERQWYADDDDDDEDDDEDDTDGGASAKMAASTPVGSVVSSVGFIRPGLDAGHTTISSSSPPTTTTTSAHYAAQQHQQLPPPPQPDMVTPSPPPPPHQWTSGRIPPPPPGLVPYTPTAAALAASSSHHAVTPTAAQQQQYRVQQQQQLALLDSSGGGFLEEEQDESMGRKPDVQMFLPMLRVLGKGSFGKVVLVQKRDGKDTGQLFAMKILKKTHLVKRRQIERTRTERKVLSVVNHPFIMKLHYAFQSPEKLYLVLDYCPGGELFFHLSRFRRFPERVARFYAAELLLAIGHLHKRGIIYRDLKPENVLLDADGHVKLGDFGLAKAGIQHPYEGATSMCGTPEYMAPEVLAQLGHGFCVDYWGLGMIVYEMMTGLPPWYTTDRQQLFRRLKSAPLDIPTYFSSHAAAFVASLLERNPRRRLGVTGIRVAMEHDFFRNMSWRALYSRRVDAPVRPCEGWRPDNPDVATQNFDAQFTRMPVDSGDAYCDTKEEVLLDEQLDENTFLGFSFDIVANGAAKPADARHRTTTPQYNQNNNHNAHRHSLNDPSSSTTTAPI